MAVHREMLVAGEAIRPACSTCDKNSFAIQGCALGVFFQQPVKGELTANYARRNLPSANVRFESVTLSVCGIGDLNVSQ
jgi:hypothetical protein